MCTITVLRIIRKPTTWSCGPCPSLEQGPRWSSIENHIISPVKHTHTNNSVYKTVGLPGLAGGLDLGFSFPWNGIPHPHQVTWSQPINTRLARKREPIRGKLKSLWTPKFEKSPRRFGPIRLLCKHVTNLLKPATNCLCTPYKLGNSLGSALSDPHHCVGHAAGALTRVSN